MDLIKKLILILVVILIIYYIFITIKIILNNRNIKYPPVESKCPNYFIPKNILNRVVCEARPIYDINNINCESVDITDLSQEEKCEWSKLCNIYWEGITNKEINNNSLC